MPEKLEKQLVLIMQTAVDWCYCDCEYFLDKTGKAIGNYSSLMYSPKTGSVAEALMMGNFIASPTPVVSKAIFEDAGYFDESPEIQSREDWEEWIRIATVSPIVYIPEALTKHRIHKNSITFMEDPDRAYSSHVSVIEKLCTQYPDRFEQGKTKALAYYATEFSKSHFLRGNFQKAKNMICTAIQWDYSNARKLLLMLYSAPPFLLTWTLNVYRFIKRNQ
jgi:hypothetical protein